MTRRLSSLAEKRSIDKREARIFVALDRRRGARCTLDGGPSRARPQAAIACAPHALLFSLRNA